MKKMTIMMFIVLTMDSIREFTRIRMFGFRFIIRKGFNTRRVRTIFAIKVYINDPELRARQA